MRTVLSAALTLCLLDPPAAVAQTTGVAAPDPAAARQRLLRATVSVRDGAVDRARGVVLAGDGRIVTALATVEGVRDLRVAYPDGRVVRARVSVTDGAWGLAVLEGTGARWPEGVALAEGDGRSGDAAVWVPAAGARPVSGTLLRRRSLVGAAGALLRDAWEISPVAPRSAVGAGVLHLRTGTLAGVIVAPVGDAATTGAEGPFAVPVGVIRGALRRGMESARPWLGIVTREVRLGEDPMLAAGGLRVIEVQPGSPAQRAGITAGERGDVVVSVEGRPVVRLDDLAAAMEGRRPGDTVVLQVMRRNATTEVAVQLEALPTR